MARPACEFFRSSSKYSLEQLLIGRVKHFPLGGKELPQFHLGMEMRTYSGHRRVCCQALIDNSAVKLSFRRFGLVRMGNTRGVRNHMIDVGHSLVIRLSSGYPAIIQRGISELAEEVADVFALPLFFRIHSCCQALRASRNALHFGSLKSLPAGLRQMISVSWFGSSPAEFFRVAIPECSVRP